MVIYSIHASGDHTLIGVTVDAYLAERVAKAASGYVRPNNTDSIPPDPMPVWMFISEKSREVCERVEGIVFNRGQIEVNYHENASYTYLDIAAATETEARQIGRVMVAKLNER